MFKHIIEQWCLFWNERDAVIAVVIGLILYAFIYPQPYKNQVAIEQPLAVVDFDNTNISRMVIRMIDASPDVAVASFYHSEHDALEAMADGDVVGMMTIPRDFTKDIYLGKQVSLPYQTDGSYFLVYSGISKAVSSVATELAAKVKVLTSVRDGKGAQSWWPFVPKLMAVFNSTGGYASYVIPGVFILLLHQTLLLASGLLGVGGRESTKHPTSELAARSMVLIAVYVTSAHFYFGTMFDQYGVSRAMQYRDMWLLLVPFLLSTVLLGTFIGLLSSRKDTPSQIVFISSMPLLFVSGFIWPVENIPETFVLLSQLFPSTHGISGFLRLNQLGSDFSELIPQISYLWGLVALYGFTCSYMMLKKK